MSDVSEKPFEATPRRIAKAKREGNVARSSELPANCSFAAAGLALAGVVPVFAAVATNALRLSFHSAAPAACALTVAVALVPIGCASLAGVVAGVAASGGLVLVAIEPKIERLNPVEGLRRMLSRETLGHSLRSTLAFACATLAMIPALWSAAAMLRLQNLDETVARTWSAAGQVAMAAGAVGVIFSVAEFGAARRAWLRKLRMSFEERKRESKEEEGDVLARGRRRALHRALLRGGLGRVKEAAFVVANPTHVAVALAYAPPRVAVPEVLVRAQDEVAKRVRELAAQYRIPVVEDVALARALYADGRAGEPIPLAHYVAVAEVVAALMRAGTVAR